MSDRCEVVFEANISLARTYWLATWDRYTGCQSCQSKRDSKSRLTRLGASSPPAVAKCGIVENVLTWAEFKQSKDLKKTDGAKRQRITGITKLDDANDAGGRNSQECTLILTEGDSAKALAVSPVTIRLAIMCRCFRSADPRNELNMQVFWMVLALDVVESCTRKAWCGTKFVKYLCRRWLELVWLDETSTVVFHFEESY